MMVSSVILVARFIDGKVGEPVDLLKEQAFYSPQAPFGGAEDFAPPDSKAVLYVCKKEIRNRLCCQYQYRYLSL
jgi:hypothetical protein